MKGDTLPGLTAHYRLALSRYQDFVLVLDAFRRTGEGFQDARAAVLFETRMSEAARGLMQAREELLVACLAEWP